MHIALKGKLRLDRAPETESERHDLRTIKIALMRLGYYTPDAKTGMGEDVDANFTDALYAYQRKSTVAFDDTGLGPDSTTLRLVNEDLAGLDDSESYIWRTVGDEKVRGEHAARNGKRFSWDNPPEGGHAGEDYNCRCWAEPLVASYHPWMAWAQERRELRAKLAPPLGLNTEPLIEETEPTAGKIAGYTALGVGVLLLSRYARKLPIKTILSTLIKNTKPNDIFTGHGNTRAAQRNISEKDIQEAIKSAELTGNKITKMGRYNTPQIHYKGSNGVTVIIETEGRNAGKVITTYRN